nr:hypothetical protein [Tanacetum cinerariifolium]
MRIDPTMNPKEETYQVIIDVMKNSSFFKAFLTSSVVPEIYMQQFYHTVTKVKDSTFYEFKLANKKCLVDVEVFRQALDIFPRVPGKVFIVHPSEEELLSFLVGLFNDDAILSRMKFVKIGEDVQEYGRAIPDAMLTDVIKQFEVYQMFIKYSTGLIPLKKTRGKGSQGKKAAVSPKPTSDEESDETNAKHARKRTDSRKVIKKKVSISVDDNIIPELDVTLELGKSMSLTEAIEEEASKQVHVTHERIVIESDGDQTLTPEEKLAADIIQALKESKKINRRQPNTRGSSKGTGRIPGVLDESIEDSEYTKEDDDDENIEWVHTDEDEEKNDDDDDKSIDLEKTDDEETNNEFVHSEEHNGDKEITDTTKANAEKAEEVKDDIKKSELPPSSFSLSISLDAKINSLLDVQIQQEILQIQSPSILTVPILVISESSVLSPILEIPTYHQQQLLHLLSMFLLSYSKTTTPIPTPPITTEALPVTMISDPLLTIKEPVEEPAFKMATYDVEQTIDDVVNDADQPSDDTTQTNDKYPKYDCVKVKKLHGYGHLEEIIVRRADRQLYKFKECDFIDLQLNDIEDMLLFAVQHKLFQLDGSDIVDFIMALWVIYKDLNKQKRVMQADELYKFSDETLKTVRDELHHRLLGFLHGLNDDMPRRKCSTTSDERLEILEVKVSSFDGISFRSPALSSETKVSGPEPLTLEVELVLEIEEGLNFTFRKMSSALDSSFILEVVWVIFNLSLADLVLSTRTLGLDHASHTRRSSKQKVENSNFEEHLPPVATMADNRTMAEMLCAPTERCAEAIVVPSILAEQFELKHRAARRSLEKEPPRSITTWDDVVSKFINEFFPPSRTTNLRNEISNFHQKFDESFHEAWERYKDLLRACPHHCFTELHQLDTFYNALNPADQNSLNAAAGGNLLEKSPQDALTIIENKSKVRNSRSKPIASPVKACDINSSSEIAKLTHAVNQQTSDMTTAMTAMLKQLQATPPPALVKAVKEICVTCGGAHPYYQCLATGSNTFPKFRDNIQGYVSATASNYNQSNPGYRPQGIANQMRPPGFAQPNVQNNQNRFGQPQGFNRGTNFNQEQSYQATAQPNQNFHLNELEKIKRMNDVSMKAMQNQIDMVKNKLRNEKKTSIQTSLSNQTNEIKNMMASLLQMNTASTLGSGSLPSNTIANPKGELKAITTRSGLVTDGPTVPTPPKSITPEVDERVEETYTDPDLAEYTIKVPPPPVQKYKPPSQRNFIVHTRDSPLLNIPYPSRMLKQKQQEKDEKMLKAFLSNKEKLQELANTPLNENFSVVILKKLPEKLGDPGKFLIPCGFSELKCKALADLGASINLMPLSVWKELGLPDLIPTRMTLELVNRTIYTPDGIARDVFVSVGKFTLPADFVVVDYDSDPRAPFILGRPFLRTARALIDVHSEEMILRDGDERLTLNMKHDTASYSNNPHRESVNLINIFNVSSEDFLEVSVSKQSSGMQFLSEELPDIDSFNNIYPYFDDNPLSGSTTYSSNSLLEEFTDELARITYPLDYDDNLQFDIEFDVYEVDFLEDESDADNFYDDPFDSKGEKIKESKLLINELDLPYDFLPYFEYDSFDSQDFSKVDALPSTNNEDKDFDPPFYEPLFFKDVPKSKMLLPFSSENEEKVFKPGIYTFEKVKEKQEKDKIETKPDRNGKRGKARQCRRPITVEKPKKKEENTSSRAKYANPTKLY